MTPRAARGLADWLHWQEQLHPRGIALGRERVRVVAERLALPATLPTLTVAGTNGKGSSATLAASIYQHAGYRVGLYTSPHLLHYNERVQIDGAPASDDVLCAAFAAIEAVRGEVPLTYFEFGTLAALWCFREARLEVQVLEVGLGGRLDAVNLVDADVALLTNVGLDHQDWLGSDRQQIGFEKAGVFRRGRPAIVVEREPPASVLDHARSVAAILQRLGVDFDFSLESDGRWNWSSTDAEYSQLPAPGLPGAMQYQNASGVLAAIGALAPRLPVPRGAIDAALQGLSLRGRCEWHHGVLLDVAHNTESATVLADYLRANPAPATAIIVGMLADKPVASVLKILAAEAQVLIAIGLPSPRGLSAEQLQGCAADTGLVVHSCENMRAALIWAREQVGAAGRVVVTGSFLTVAAAITELDAIF